ncbi:DUF805 domain-containing protein [Vibrio sp. S4M6]|uniref:DUF805 domain-containing protein n=1 Tax=Vibrio sinus TaxID=2946865 RepID=UPI00202AC201|nr:DUF805 domain-containing protein [Vibrio sinus]MCL9783186.1 DUF805 domain-containing protein [Vibrio sinus]
MKWYIQAFKKYAVFTGRARRKEYWYFILFNTIVMMLLMVVSGIASFLNPDTAIGFSVLYFIYALVAFIPTIAVSVRRLHDTNRSGWMMLIQLIPIVGAIVLLVLFVFDSQPGENQYGVNPKHA